MKTTSALALVCAALLSACSGGDDDKQPNDPNNHDFATATVLGSPGSARGNLASDEEYDFYKVTVPAGITALNIQTFDAGGTSCDLANDGVDPFVEVFNASEGFVTASDDSGINWCEDFIVAVTPGAVYYVVVSGYPPYPFTYTLKVTPVTIG